MKKVILATLFLMGFSNPSHSGEVQKNWFIPVPDAKIFLSSQSDEDYLKAKTIGSWAARGFAEQRLCGKLIWVTPRVFIQATIMHSMALEHKDLTISNLIIDAFEKEWIAAGLDAEICDK